MLSSVRVENEVLSFASLDTLLSFLCIPMRTSCSVLPTSNVISYSSVPLSHFKIKLINISISHGVINTTLGEMEDRMDKEHQ